MIRRRGGIRLYVTNDYAEGKNVDYSRFFERFYREDKSHNQDKGGYGIGLSIAQNICEQYNGSIKASWSEGKITFTCILNETPFKSCEKKNIGRRKEG